MSKKRIIKLKPNHETFCQLYAGGGEYCGNGVWSYILANKLENKVPLVSYSSLKEKQKRGYESAKSLASQLLTKLNIKERCNEILDALIKDEIVDRELVRVIMQNDELSAKVSAIKEYNQLKKRIDNKPQVIISIGKTLDELENGTATTG